MKPINRDQNQYCLGEGMGYKVGYSQVHIYGLSRLASKRVVHDHPQSWCQVLHPVDAVTSEGELVEFHRS